MDDTAQLILDKLHSLERRIERLEALVTTPETSTLSTKPSLASIVVMSNVKGEQISKRLTFMPNTIVVDQIPKLTVPPLKMPTLYFCTFFHQCLLIFRMIGTRNIIMMHTVPLNSTDRIKR
jgi:hypothetical protein